MRVVGIDPGQTRIGYALLETHGSTFCGEIMGTWEIRAKEQAARLRELEKVLTRFLTQSHPDRIGVERLFFTTNRRTAMAVAEARGVIILTAGKFRIPIVELTPSAVKRAVTGDGTAPKSVVARMARRITGLPLKPSLDDATDALAIAIAASGRLLHPH